MERPILVVVCDDNAKLREQIVLLISEASPEMMVISETANGKELFKVLEVLRPDVVLLDLKMPELDGSTALDLMTEKYPGIKVIILSTYNEQILIDDMMMRGAKGYLPKSELSELTQAIRIVSKDRLFKFNNPFARAAPWKRRQKEIVTLISEGNSQKEIAGTLKVSRQAIHNQEKKIMKFLGIKFKGELKPTIFERGLNYIRGFNKKKVTA